jgi:predicted dehydrogenase
MKNDLSLAVVGCGYWGAKHVRVCRDTPPIRLVLASDRCQDRLDYIRSEYRDIAVTTSFEAVLASDVAGIIIATPISTHFSLASAALEAGKHVLIEKPMATTSAECRKLISIAAERNLVVMVGHTFEYHPAVAFIRRAIRRGELGKIYSVSSRRLNLGQYQSDANVLWDLAPHDFSIIFSVLEQYMEQISAWGCMHILPGVEDVVYANMAFKGGVTAHLHVSWLDPVKVRQVTVVGSEGMLIFDDVLPSEKVRVYDKRFKPIYSGDSYADFHSAYHHGDVHIPSLSNIEPLKLEVLDFVNAIVNGERPRVDGQSGLRVVEALEAATCCLHDKQTTDLLAVRDHQEVIVTRSPERMAAHHRAS